MFQASARQENPMMHVTMSIQKLLQRFWVKLDLPILQRQLGLITLYQVQNHIAGNIMVHDILKYIQKDDSMKKTFTRLEQHAIVSTLHAPFLSPTETA